MSQIYEGMFVLDNDLVRAGWPQAKALVTDLLAKHEGVVHTSRRWAERKLAYPIKDHLRATYLLVHYEIPATKIPTFVRDLDLSERVLRYLLLKVDQIPKTEVELSAAEDSAEFTPQSPPADSVGTYRPLQSEDPEADEREAAERDESDRPGRSGPGPRASERGAAARDDAAQKADGGDAGDEKKTVDGGDEPVAVGAEGAQPEVEDGAEAGQTKENDQ